MCVCIAVMLVLCVVCVCPCVFESIIECVFVSVPVAFVSVYLGCVFVLL